MRPEGYRPSGRRSLSTLSPGSLKNASIFSKRCSLLRRTSSGQSPHRSSRPDGQASLRFLAPSSPKQTRFAGLCLGPRLARLQAEKCFFRGTCPRKKQIRLDSVVCGRRNSARLLYKIGSISTFSASWGTAGCLSISKPCRHGFDISCCSGPPPGGWSSTAPGAWAFRSCRWRCGGRGRR